MINEWALVAIAICMLILMCGRLSSQIRELRFAVARASYLEIIVSELIEAQRAELRGEREAARKHAEQARNAYITIDAAGRV